MKHLKVITVFISLSIFSFGQTLQQGVFTNVTLATDVRMGQPDASCWNYEFEFSSNSLPYVTGMNLFLTIDSIAGSTDSIQIWRWPDYVMTYMHAHDTIPINSRNNIYVYFLDLNTLYTSLIAIGTPQIVGESYFCNYSKSLQLWVDGCNNFFSMISGGNGPMDTIKGCLVQNPTGLNETKEGGFEIYPNPSNDNLIVESNVMGLSEFILYDPASRTILQQKFSNFICVNTDQLAKGIYFYQIINKIGSTETGKVVKN